MVRTYRGTYHAAVLPMSILLLILGAAAYAESPSTAAATGTPDAADESGVLALEFSAGPLWIGNAAQYHDDEKVHGSTVSPLKILPTVTMRYRLASTIRFTAGLGALYQEYLELPDGSPWPGKAVPTGSHIGSDSPYFATGSDDQQNVAGVIVLPLQLGLDFPLLQRPAFQTGPGIGLVLLSRIPVLITGESTGGIARYHWGAGRFLQPELNWSTAFHTFEGFTYGIRIRSWLPMANLWAGEDGVAWWDGTGLQLQGFIRLQL